MRNLGLSKTFLCWLINYLTDRHHFLQIDDKSSSSKEITFGVFQGSILGPATFKLYVSELQEKIQCKCIQYADDTTIYLHLKGFDLQDTCAKMNCVIGNLGLLFKYVQLSNLQGKNLLDVGFYTANGKGTLLT